MAIREGKEPQQVITFPVGSWGSPAGFVDWDKAIGGGAGAGGLGGEELYVPLNRRQMGKVSPEQGIRLENLTWSC